MTRIPDSELLLNADKSVYHLHLKPENLAHTVILVGDPGRVPVVSKYFDNIDFTVQNREIVVHTGSLGNKRLTVLSTGMGTDSLDIIINELDAVVNIDLDNRVVKDLHTSLDIIRIGTSGGLQPDIAPGTYVASSFGIGLDGLLYFYKDHYKVINQQLTDAFRAHTDWKPELPSAYAVKSSDELMKKLGEGLMQGITLTAPGFYGPQGRKLRLPLAYPELNNLFESFEFKGNRITNFEMETSALYGLAGMLGHRALTICTVMANRVTRGVSADYKVDIEHLVQHVLEKITS